MVGDTGEKTHFDYGIALASNLGPLVSSVAIWIRRIMLCNYWSLLYRSDDYTALVRKYHKKENMNIVDNWPMVSYERRKSNNHKNVKNDRIRKGNFHVIFCIVF